MTLTDRVSAYYRTRGRAVPQVRRPQQRQWPCEFPPCPVTGDAVEVFDHMRREHHPERRHGLPDRRATSAAARSIPTADVDGEPTAGFPGREATARARRSEAAEGRR